MNEKKERITTDKAPQAIGPYSQAIKMGKQVYFSGQIPLDPVSMELVSGDFRQQAEQVFTNLKALSMASGGDLENILKLTIYLTDLKQFATLNEVMMRFFHEPYPARTTIQVSALPMGAQLEIEALLVL